MLIIIILGLLLQDAINMKTLHNILELEEYEACDTLFIEEAQFFEDLYLTVTLIVEKHNKHVVLSGLDGNCKQY